MTKGKIENVKFAFVPVKAAEIIKKKRKVLKRSPRKRKYSNKEEGLVITEDYNLLRLQLLVRPFFTKKYNIEIRFLELLMFLYPKNYFSYADYHKIPKSFKYIKLLKMVEAGHFVIVIEGKSINQHVYGLSRQSKRLVEKYYKYLSGEISFSKLDIVEDELKGLDKKRNDLITSLAESPLAPMTKYFQ